MKESKISKQNSKKVIVKSSLLGSILLLVQTIIFLAIGIFFIVASVVSEINEQNILNMRFIALALLVFGLISAVSFIFIRKKRIITTLISGVLTISLSLFVFFNPDTFFVSIIYIMAVWASINFIFRLVLCVQLKKNNAQGFVRAIVDCVISLFFATYFFTNPQNSYFLLYLIIGLYFISYSLTIFGDFLRELLKWDLDGKYIKRKVKLRIPVLLTAFLPNKFFNNLNESFNDTHTSKIDYVKESSKDLETPLEVFVHTSPKIALGFGHVDISFNGTIYSYGIYDDESIKYGGAISDGVYVKMNREKYIKHCLKVDEENIIGYSIHLTQEQKEDMQKYIEEFDKQVYRWKCKQEVDTTKDYSDPASVFYKKADAKFYKFYKGKFKTYFALKTNCVEVADMLVGSSGIDVITFNGIITPGTYLRYLENTFNRANSFVVKKTTYASKKTT